MATSGASAGPQVPGGFGQTDPRQAGEGMDKGVESDEHDNAPDPEEEALVDKRMRCYEQARKFDENFRKQVAIDRRYAAGTSDLAWAVTTNLLGHLSTFSWLCYMHATPMCRCSKSRRK